MEYLKLQAKHLNTIDLKNFGFPHLLSYVDQNRTSDDDPTLSVWFRLPGDRASHYVYSGSDQSEWSSVRSEVDRWNENPMEHWTQALTEAYESQMAVEQSSLQSTKERIKILRRELRRLEGL